MAAAAAAGTNRTSEPPVACSLTPADLAGQRQRWRRLAASADAQRRQTDDGLRIGFRPDAEAERELRALVAVEQDCCGWASWSVEATGEQLTLVVTAAGEGVAALHGMFAELG